MASSVALATQGQYKRSQALYQLLHPHMANDNVVLARMLQLIYTCTQGLPDLARQAADQLETNLLR